MFPAGFFDLRGNADSGDSCYRFQAETIAIGGKKSIVFSDKGIYVSIGAKQTAGLRSSRTEMRSWRVFRRAAVLESAVKRSEPHLPGKGVHYASNKRSRGSCGSVLSMPLISIELQ
jgi:hypothetical protein